MIFDLDDTLFDHSGSVRRALEVVGRQHPALARRPIGEVAALYQRLLEEAHPAIVRGRLSPESARVGRFDAIFRWAGARPSRATLEEVARAYRDEYQRQRRRVPGSLGVLRAIRPRARVAVLSNNRRSEQEEKLAVLGLAPLVDLVVTSEEIPWPKPDPRAFRHTVCLAGTRPEQATMVGDSWEVDIAGARSAGLGAVWLHRSGPDPPDLDGVEELPSLRPATRAAAAILRAKPARSGEANAY